MMDEFVKRVQIQILLKKTGTDCVLEVAVEAWESVFISEAYR
jgi:hypothetical protein